MRTKATLFLVILVLALGAAAHFIKRRGVDPGGAENQRLVFPVEMVNLDHLEVTITDRTPASVVLRRRAGGWEITEPVRWPANFFAVNSILTQLQFLERVNAFPVASIADSNQTLADYGLAEDAPVGRLVLGRGDTRHVVRLGRDTQTLNRMYLLPEGGDQIIVVPNTVRDVLTLGVDRLRSPAVFSVQDYEVRSWSVQLTEPTQVRIYLAREGERWRLETPIEARADTAAVQTLLRNITGLQVLDFVPAEATAPALLGLASPDIRITLEGGGRREALLIGDRVPGDASPARYYARLEDTPGQEQTAAFIIAPDFIDAVRNAQLGLRERRVLDFDPAALRSIRITDASQRELTLQRLESGAWQVSARAPDAGPVTMPGDRQRIEKLTTELAELRAIPGDGFVRDAALAADLESFGLTGATAWQVDITELIPGEGDRPPAPRAQRLLLGRAADQPGRPIYARVEDRGFVYLVDRALADELSTRPIDFRSRRILALGDGPRITALSLTHLGSRDTVLSIAPTPAQPGQTADQAWEQALAGESPERAAAVRQLLQALRQVRAASIVAAEFTSMIPGESPARAWTWLLQATIATESGAIAQQTTYSLYFDTFAGVAPLLVGAPDPGVVFTAEQALIDAFGPLIFRRPGPVALPEVPEAPEAPPRTDDTPAEPATDGGDTPEPGA